MFRKKFAKNGKVEDYKITRMPELIFAGIGDIIDDCRERSVVTSYLTPTLWGNQKRSEETIMVKEFEDAKESEIMYSMSENNHSNKKMDSHIDENNPRHCSLPNIVTKQTASPSRITPPHCRVCIKPSTTCYRSP